MNDIVISWLGITSAIGQGKQILRRHFYRDTTPLAFLNEKAASTVKYFCAQKYRLYVHHKKNTGS